MKITPVAGFGLQLTRFGFVNCYLVREPDGFTLIDASLPNSEDAILAAAANAGAPIRRIVLTHAHGDHVGSVDALIAKLGAIEVAATRRSVPLLRHPADTSIEAGETNRPIPQHSGIRTGVTRILAEGESCGSLRVIDTPGHIPGHISFLDERDGTLYAGDAIIGVGGLSIAGYAPWYASPMNSFTWDKKLALASAKKLLDYKIKRFATGHLGVRERGVHALSELVAKASA